MGCLLTRSERCSAGTLRRNLSDMRKQPTVNGLHCCISHGPLRKCMSHGLFCILHQVLQALPDHGFPQVPMYVLCKNCWITPAENTSRIPLASLLSHPFAIHS